MNFPNISAFVDRRYFRRTHFVSCYFGKAKSHFVLVAMLHEDAYCVTNIIEMAMLYSPLLQILIGF